MHVVIPVNCSATVFIPIQDKGSVTESGKLAELSPGVQFIRKENGWAEFHIESGEYDFKSKNIQEILLIDFETVQK